MRGYRTTSVLIASYRFFFLLFCLFFFLSKLSLPAIQLKEDVVQPAPAFVTQWYLPLRNPFHSVLRSPGLLPSSGFFIGPRAPDGFFFPSRAWAALLQPHLVFLSLFLSDGVLGVCLFEFVSPLFSRLFISCLPVTSDNGPAISARLSLQLPFSRAS